MGSGTAAGTHPGDSRFGVLLQEEVRFPEQDGDAGADELHHCWYSGWTAIAFFAKNDASSSFVRTIDISRPYVAG